MILTCGITYSDTRSEAVVRAMREQCGKPVDGGCGRPLDLSQPLQQAITYRCVECGRWMCRPCILRHFAETGDDIAPRPAPRMGTMSDEIESIRSEHVQAGDAGDPHCAMCSDASYPIWPCDTAIVLARLDALTAERDDALARLAAAEAALAPCTLAREYRDGVTCRDERDDKGVCFNHRVVRGLRVHAVTADRLELENRALRRQVRATYGIIHEGLHGGKPTDPEHQELCERPACRNARAALAGSREQAQGEGDGE